MQNSYLGSHPHPWVVLSPLLPIICQLEGEQDPSNSPLLVFAATVPFVPIDQGIHTFSFPLLLFNQLPPSCVPHFLLPLLSGLSSTLLNYCSWPPSGSCNCPLSLVLCHFYLTSPAPAFCITCSSFLSLVGHKHRETHTAVLFSQFQGLTSQHTRAAIAGQKFCSLPAVPGWSMCNHSLRMTCAIYSHFEAVGA